MASKRMALVLGLGLAGCSVGTQDKIESKAEAMRATAAGRAVVDAAVAVGLLPKLTCGAPHREAWLAFKPALKQRLGGCATLEDAPGTAASDGVAVVMPAGGCDVGGRRWTGRLTASLSGGEDRTAIGLDLRGLQIDGHPVEGQISRTSCGDLDTYEVHLGIGAPVDGKHLQLHFDGTGAMKPGIALIGTDVLVLNGAAKGDLDGQGVGLAFDQLEWEPGGNLPAQGKMAANFEGDHAVALGFDDEIGLMTFSVDGSPAIPLPRP